MLGAAGSDRSGSAFHFASREDPRRIGVGRGRKRREELHVYAEQRRVERVYRGVGEAGVRQGRDTVTALSAAIVTMPGQTTVVALSRTIVTMPSQTTVVALSRT